MPKHHTEDYKLTAVKYYLKNNTTYKNVCDILCTVKEVWRDKLMIEIKEWLDTCQKMHYQNINNKY